jgi:hypothetical protein
MVGLHGQVISPSQGHYLHIRQHKHRINVYTNIHALSGVRTHNPSVRENEDRIYWLYPSIRIYQQMLWFTLSWSMPVHWHTLCPLMFHMQYSEINPCSNKTIHYPTEKWLWTQRLTLEWVGYKGYGTATLGLEDWRECTKVKWAAAQQGPWSKRKSCDFDCVQSQQ